MRARLTVLVGAKTKQVDLYLPTVIGRGRDAKIKLPSSTVSRQHCEIYDYEGQIAIRDLGSSNGTLVNGHRIEGPTFVSSEDEVIVGPVKFQLSGIPKDVSSPATYDEIADDAKSDSSAPDLDQLPAATKQPVEADESIAAPEVPAFDECGSGDDESVLRYVRPKDDGARSFVGIETAAPVPEAEEAAPKLTNQDAPAEVPSDDSSLQNFFNNLDS